MTIPNTYRKSKENQFVNYDYQDISSGVGYSTFYLLTTQDATIQYSLQPNNLNYSSIRDTSQNGNGTRTLTFDSSEFNLPRTINGTAYLSLGVSHNLGAVANTYTARLFKWNGSSATAITPLSTWTGGYGVIQSVYSFELPCTETIIKKGEQLRLIVTMTNLSGAGTYMAIGHDPKNFDGAKVTPSTADTITSSRINIPFKINI